MAKTQKLQDSLKLPPNSSITINNSQRKFAISVPSAQKLASFLLKKSGYMGMAIHFVGMRKISLLHLQYFNDPTPTDCISFPYEDPLFLGEVFVCPQIAKNYVDRTKGDLEKELTLYIVHGFLHLLGFDDQTDAERKKMRAGEEKWMRTLAKNNLYVTIR